MQAAGLETQPFNDLERNFNRAFDSNVKRLNICASCYCLGGLVAIGAGVTGLVLLVNSDLSQGVKTGAGAAAAAAILGGLYCAAGGLLTKCSLWFMNGAVNDYQKF